MGKPQKSGWTRVRELTVTRAVVTFSTLIIAVSVLLTWSFILGSDFLLISLVRMVLADDVRQYSVLGWGVNALRIALGFVVIVGVIIHSGFEMFKHVRRELADSDGNLAQRSTQSRVKAGGSAVVKGRQYNGPNAS